MPAYGKGAVVPTYPLYKHRGDLSGCALAMFLRSKRRFKDGKEHRYFSGVENRRVGSGRVAQRRVLYLGEINDSQQAGWRKTLEVFDEAEQRATTLSLFPEDREIPADALDGVQVKLKEMELRRPRAFGWPRKTGCIAVWIASWNIKWRCLITCSSAGKTCSRRGSMCCCTT